MATQDTNIGRKAALPVLDSEINHLLTAEEIAAVLRLHPGSVRRLVMNGEIPHLKIGRSVRFRLADVMAFAARGGDR